MSKRRRVLVFVYAAFACLAADIAVSVHWSQFDTGVRFDAWWCVLPPLIGAALVVQPAWGSVDSAATFAFTIFSGSGTNRDQHRLEHQHPLRPVITKQSQ